MVFNLQNYIKLFQNFHNDDYKICPLGVLGMIGTHTNVIKNVQDFELLAGSPARRLGWVSKAREKLDLPPEGSGEAVCPKTGTRYVLEKNILRKD